MSIDLSSLVKIFIDSLCGPVDTSNPTAADLATFMVMNSIMSGNWSPVNNTLGPVKSFLANSGQFNSVAQRKQIISSMLQKALNCLRTDMQINLYIGNHAKDNSDPLNGCLLLANKYLSQVVSAYIDYDISNSSSFAEAIHSIFRDLCKYWHAALTDAFSSPVKAFEFVKLISAAAAGQMSESFSANPAKAQMFSGLITQLYTNLVNEGTAPGAASQ